VNKGALILFISVVGGNKSHHRDTEVH